MPLFVNGYVSPQVFRNNDKIAEQSNQEKFRLNYLQEILYEQQKFNDELTGSVTKFDRNLEHNRQEQYTQFQEMVSFLTKQENISKRVMENISDQKESTSEIDDKLIKLEEMHEQFAKALLNRELTSEAILNQLAHQQSMIQDLNRKLLEYEDVTNALVIQAQKQEELQDMLAKHSDLQGIFHETIMERLGKQDAVGETITDQLGDIKISLSQKANSILEKIEEQSSKFSQFFLSLIMPNITQKKIIKGKTFKTKTKQEK
ncbi:hypothetical protein [Mesobacillus selenatarsenatis]|uniref:Uncharacterized protein n=1 Tax=Mesobacillus selenatarsenatis (strain DSM 18680 / JCM 14380 / FERM P-15431 / SF-1) TaxID=1321606 RepID=A0A0A8X4T6_MESS1|nr:hypothetical protein [Mesobacillus selenatarsenatis]GAM14057.1 hypothetical protein SAMD00020551_2204 [Mesobacillus selenatarsenatis SF-1]